MPEGEGGASPGQPRGPAGEVDVSICFVNWRTAGDLIGCVRSIEAHPPACTYEVRVVDNDSRDGSVERLRAELPDACVMANPANLGFGRAANQAIAASTGRFLLLLNPDMAVDPGAIDALVAFMESEPRAGAVGGAMRAHDGRRHHSCRRFPAPWAALVRGTFLEALLPRNRSVREYLMEDWDHSSVREVDWLSGACLMLRREALDQVGVFDERYFMYLEDTDLCLRMHRSGWGVYYVPSAGFVHTIGRSSDQAQPRMIVAHHRSMWQYYCKHMARGLGVLVVPLALAAIAARCLLILAKNRVLWWQTTRIAGTNKT